MGRLQPSKSRTPRATQGGPYRRRRPLKGPRRFQRRRPPPNTRKFVKVQKRKAKAKRTASKQTIQRTAALKKSTTFMAVNNAIGVSYPDLKAVYRVIHALVALYYPQFNCEAVGDSGTNPVLSPGGLAAYFMHAIISAIRKNDNPVTAIPNENTLPDFPGPNKIPNGLALFLTALLRNKGRTYEIIAEFGDLTNIIVDPMPTQITYEATNYTLFAGPYGTLVQPSAPASASEVMFPASASTFTRANLIAAGDIISSMLAGVGGCVKYEKMWQSDEGDTNFTAYKSPVLLANPNTDNFDCRMKFQHEVAALIIDYTTKSTSRTGIIQRPYPMLNQDRYVIGAMNLLMHCRGPKESLQGKGWSFPNDVRKILDPLRSGQRWHNLGRIKTLVVTASNNNTSWYTVHRNICEQLCAVYASTTMTAAAALNLNIANFVIQAYLFSHLMDWGRQHYIFGDRLPSGAYLNAVTSGIGADFKAIPMPQNIVEIARQWRPIVVAGQVMIPDVPDVAISTFANFITFGTRITYSGTNTTEFQATAVPNGYGGALTGLYSTTIVANPAFAATSYLLAGITLNNASFGGGTTSTNQSPTVPIRLSGLFTSDWKTKFMALTDQKLFNMDIPCLGDVGMVTCTNNYTRFNVPVGSGWLSTKFDFLNSEMLIAPDTILGWRGAQYARLNVSNAAVTAITEYYPFKQSIQAGDGGVAANVLAMGAPELGQEYEALLTGMEANPKLTDKKAKYWMALDAVTSRLYDQRGGTSFEEYTTKDALGAYMLTLKEQGINMANYSYTEDTNLFQPHSLSGWLSFLHGVEATYNTGKYIFTDLWKQFGGLLGIGKMTLV